jgi:cytochrome P450
MRLSNKLLATLFPRVVAARETVARAIQQYLGVDLPDIDGATKLVLARNRTLLDGGLKVHNLARLESSFTFALLTNTVPASFWTLFEIFSRPELVADLREELAANAVHTEKADGQDVHVLDLADVRQSCPHFTSTLLEVLRTRFSSATTRMVTQDVQLGPWLLKRGNIVQIPSRYFNHGAASWGARVAEFDSRRFLRGAGGDDAAAGPQGLAKGFLTFGISPHVCPGRHFAVGEIAAMAAMVLLRFDLAPEGGEWKEPGLSSTALSSSMSPVAGDVKVTVLPRKEYEGAKWSFRVSDTNNRFNLPI